ncbi:MAG: TetR/AcrR family transcriptional regulator [Deltaproteobacteria bacterium]|uniref:TetR/AcrR family transcriptional regulator n=1 Tax=Desulfobacula sp. TaxID=2593537 RepID=UPI0019C515FC|nr:TetR/AcrR family transcriptional regulator [Candidatus Desulfobacula maris]MBL6994123.1 TetR/AcrR family transcriptional regulator [Desulfobacula sp.]
MKHKGKTNPPGRIKIMKSFSLLMAQKDFHSITTAEIAKNAQVTEGLIYKYFKDKKDLLYQVLNKHFVEFQTKIESRIAKENNCIKQLEIIIFSSLESYADNRIFSKILLLEVRNSLDFFDSGAYEMIRKYSRTILEIIKKGLKEGELKSDIDPLILRKVILGAIEHACLGEIIFGRKLDIDKVSTGIANIVFNGAKA